MTDEGVNAIQKSLLTTRGDMIRRGASIPERFAKGSSGQVLAMGASDPDWAAPVYGEGHLSLFPHNYSSIGQGTWALVVAASQIFYGYWINTSAADGDNFSLKAFLAAGTYDLRLLVCTDYNRAIADVDIDDVEVASFDLYAASTGNNGLVTETGIVVATAGIKTIKVRIDGRNASADGWYATIGLITLWRTA